MRAAKFPEHNGVLQPPHGQNEDQCLPLYVFRDGQYVISRWDPDDEDRARIAAGGPIWLWICGTNMPPASVATEYPFERRGG